MEQQMSNGSESAQKLIDTFVDSDIKNDEDFYRVATFIDDIEEYSLSPEQWAWLYNLNEKVVEYENSANVEDIDTLSVKEMKDGC